MRDCKYMSHEPYMTPSNLLLIENTTKEYTNYHINSRILDFNKDSPAGLITRLKDSEETSMEETVNITCSMDVRLC